MSTATLDGPAALLPKPGFYIKAAAVLAVVGATLWLTAIAGDLNTDTVPGVEMTLPERIGDFVGTPEEMSEAERKILPGDTEVARMRYQNPSGQTIVASIVLSGGDKRSIHRPEICLPGQGWSIGSGSVVPVPLASGRTLDIMLLNLSRPVEVAPGEFLRLRSLFGYWFVGKNTTTPLHQVRIFKTSWDRVFKKTNHRWAYVLVSSIVEDSIRPGGMNAEETTALLKDFIARIVPSFQKSEMPGASGA